jgi:hypothetical protein
MDGLVDLVVGIWEFDRALAVMFVLSMISFVGVTVLLVTKAVRAAIASTRQVHTWMRDSGRLTRPEAATPDLGPESPALVNLLITRGRTTRDAVRATVLDLVARGAATLYQPDSDPARTVVLAIRDPDGPLTAYEHRVLAELRSLGPGSPLSALPVLQPGGLRRWHRQFRREVQVDARERGLTFLDSSIVAKTMAATFVPCMLIGFGAGLGPILVLLYLVLAVIVGERSRVWLSRRGRETLARWLGVQAWLHAHAVFADLPPAAVTTWGRHLAYGAAMDVLRPMPTRPA